MKTCGRGEVYSHSFLTPARDGGGWGQLHPPATYFREGSWLGGCVEPRAGLDSSALMEKVCIPAISLTPGVVFTQLSLLLNRSAVIIISTEES
jgi:hypothetical protein